MTLVHIIGFERPKKSTINVRTKWYSQFPESIHNFEPRDIFLINLLEIHELNEVVKLTEIAEFITENEGVAIIVTAPFKVVGKTRDGRIHNYSFLPWPEDLFKTIITGDTSNFNIDSNAPEWVDYFHHSFKYHLMAPALFSSVPSGTHALLRGNIGQGWQLVAFLQISKKGRLVLLPPIKSLLMGTKTPSEKKVQIRYLEYILNELVPQFGFATEAAPKWLTEITIRNELELIRQYNELEQKIQKINDEKKILADYGITLTQKVAALFNWLGFSTEEKEIEGKHDIEISDGKYRAVVECSGSKGFFNIDKLRQLIEYTAVEGVKGVFVGNSERDKHPRDRKLSQAFSEKALERAETLGLCLITVPDLFGVCLDISTESEKKSVRESIKVCKGQWQFGSHTW